MYTYKNTFKGYYSAIILPILLILLAVPLNPYVALVLSLLFLFVSYMLYAQKTLTFENLSILLLASSAYTQAINISGINISISDVYLILSIIYLLLVSKFKIKTPKKYLIIVLLYLIYCIVSLNWTAEINKSIPRLIQYIEFMLITTVVFFNIGTLKLQKKILFLFIINSTALSFIAIFVRFTISSTEPLYFGGFHKNALGWIFGGSIPLIYGLMLLTKNKKYRVFLFFVLISNALALIFTMSRGALLGSIAAIFALLFLSNKKKQIFILLLLLMISVFVVQAVSSQSEYLSRLTDFSENSSAYSRIIIYEHAKTYIQQKPLLGWGLGNYFINLPQINFSQDDPNNLILLNIVELGYIGLLLFLLIPLYVFIKAFKNKKLFKNDPEKLILNGMLFSVFVGRLLHMQVDVSWVRGSAVLMFAVVGMMMALPYIPKDKNAITEENKTPL